MNPELVADGSDLLGFPEAVGPTPPTTIGVYANVTACRAAAASGLTHYEIFYATPKTNRPGPGGIATGGSPNQGMH